MKQPGGKIIIAFVVLCVALILVAVFVAKDCTAPAPREQEQVSVSHEVEEQEPQVITLPERAINYIPTESVTPNLITFDAFRTPGGWESQRNEYGNIYLPVWRFDSPDGTHTAIKYLPLQAVGDADGADPYFEGSGYIQIVANKEERKLLAEYIFPKFTSEDSIEWISNTTLAVTLSGGEGGGRLEATQMISTDGSVVQTAYSHCMVGEPDECITSPVPSELRAQADRVVLALKNQDGVALSSITHPTKGVSFSNYLFVDPKTDLHFTADQVFALFKDTQVYAWGFQEGSGFPVEKTFKQYIAENIYGKDFSKATEVVAGKPKLGSVAAVSNLQKVYPDATTVTYYFPGFDSAAEGMDWEALYLAFEKQNDTWHLVHVARGYWTP